MRRIIIISIVVVLAAMLWFVMSLRPPAGSTGGKTVTVKAGSGVNEISRTLHSASVIRSKLLFETLVWLMEAEADLQAGSYEFSSDDSLLTVIERLRSGKLVARDAVTLIEGWTRAEYRSRLAQEGFSAAEFDNFTSDAAQWGEKYGFINYIPRGASLEGYLFPDTYAVRADRSVEDIVAKMLENFDLKLSVIGETKRVDMNTIHELVTMASILEKEVRGTDDRRNVADIFYKRLQSEMPLQSDATVNYITGSGRARSTAADLAIDSPYNTYKNKGLPPGPIGNPGLDALEAALAPLPNDYYYFLTDARGTVHYARTFEEHQENRKRYLE